MFHKIFKISLLLNLVFMLPPWILEGVKQFKLSLSISGLPSHKSCFALTGSSNHAPNSCKTCCASITQIIWCFEFRLLFRISSIISNSVYFELFILFRTPSIISNIVYYFELCLLLRIPSIISNPVYYSRRQYDSCWLSLEGSEASVSKWHLTIHGRLLMCRLMGKFLSLVIK